MDSFVYFHFDDDNVSCEKNIYNNNNNKMKSDRMICYSFLSNGYEWKWNIHLGLFVNTVVAPFKIFFVHFDFIFENIFSVMFDAFSMFHFHSHTFITIISFTCVTHSMRYNTFLFSSCKLKITSHTYFGGTKLPKIINEMRVKMDQLSSQLHTRCRFYILNFVNFLTAS